jgi:hypothetical protein
VNGSRGKKKQKALSRGRMGNSNRKVRWAQRQWLKPVIPATWEAEIRRIEGK